MLGLNKVVGRELMGSDGAEALKPQPFYPGIAMAMPNWLSIGELGIARLTKLIQELAGYTFLDTRRESIPMASATTPVTTNSSLQMAIPLQVRSKADAISAIKVPKAPAGPTGWIDEKSFLIGIVISRRSSATCRLSSVQSSIGTRGYS